MRFRYRGFPMQHHRSCAGLARLFGARLQWGLRDDLKLSARDSRRPYRRRLMVSSALGVGIGATVSMAVAPGAAWADSECGAQASATVTCSSADPQYSTYPNGITYFSNGDLTLNVPSPIAIDTSGTLGIGVILVAGNPTDVLNLNTGGASINTSDPGSYGILLGGTNGAVSANAGQINTSGAAATGILAVNDTGAAMVNFSTVYTQGDGARALEVDTGSGPIKISGSLFSTLVTKGTGADAIYASSNSGAVGVQIGTVLTYGDGSGGVHVVSGTGAVDVTGDAIVTSGAGSAGVAVNTAGGVVVDLTQVQTTGDNSDALVATSSGGAVDVTVGVATANGVNARAAVITGSGAASFSSNQFVGTGGDDAPAILIRAGSGAATVNSASTFSHGAHSNVIDAASTSGSVSVTGGSVSAFGEYSAGVVASALGAGGGVTVNVNSIQTNGLNAALFAPGSSGVWARTTDGDINVTTQTISTKGAGAYGVNALSSSGGDIVVKSGAISTLAADGISAISNYGGGVKITATKTTTGGDGSIGIYAGARQGAVVVSGGDVSTTGFNAAGIYAVGGTGTKVDFGSVSTTGSFSAGVDAETDSGGVTVSGISVSTKGTDALGVFATAKTGDVNVTVGTVKTTGGNAVGIYATAPGGAVNVNAANVSTAAAIGGQGVFASGVSATVVSSGAISTTGDSKYGDSGTAVTIKATTGDATASLNNVSTTGAGALGIDAYSAGGGVIITQTGALSTKGANAVGIRADGEGASGVVISGGGPVSTTGAYASGVYAASNKGPISVTAGSVNTAGNASNAIAAVSYSGAVTVSSGPISTTGVNSVGVFASSNGPVSVATTGTLKTTGLDSTGILAVSNGGSVTVNSQSVTTTGDNAGGLIVQGATNVVVTTGSVQTSGADATGIYAGSTFGDTTVKVTGAGVTATKGTGIYARGDHVVITTAAGSTVSGATDGITLQAGTSSTLNLAGTLTSSGAYAIEAFSGPVNVNNSGVITGKVRFASGADTVTNTGTFNATGSSDFGAGADVFNNSGTFNVLPGAVPTGNVTLAGLETFNNTGLVNLSNGRAGDTLTIPGVFAAGTGSQLTIDVAAQGPGPATADSLVITSASGQTLVNVHSLGTPGLTSGVTVVNGSAASPATAFTVAPGSADQGFVRYLIAYDPAGADFNLVGVPGPAAYEAAKAPSLQRDLWQRSSDSWSARMSEQRDAKTAGEPGGDSFQSWAQFYGGGDSQRDVRSTAVFGQTQTYDLHEDQSYYGLQAGLDAERSFGAKAVTLGITTGYANTDLTFRTPDRMRLQAYNLGAYVGFTSGGWFINGLVKYDWNSGSLSSRLAGFRQDLHGHSFGVTGETGYRFGGPSLYAEPIGSLSYVRTQTNDFSQVGGNLNYSNADGWRAKVGARVGGSMTLSSGAKLVPYAQVEYVRDFHVRGDLFLDTGGGAVDLVDSRRRPFAQVAAGLTLITTQRWSAFFEADGDFGNGNNGTGGRAGVRLRW